MHRSLFQGRYHRLKRKIIHADHIGDFIKYHQVQPGIGQHALSMLPHGKAGIGIGLAILRFPGEAGSHHLKLHAVLFQQIALAVWPLAFDKLNGCGTLTMPAGAERGAKRRRGLTFAIAGKHHQDAPDFTGCGNAGIDVFFQTLLSLLVPFIRHYSAAPGFLPGWASKLIPVLRRLSSPIKYR